MLFSRNARIPQGGGHFLWPAIHGGHPAGRRCATLKMAPGHFLWAADHELRAIKNRPPGPVFQEPVAVKRQQLRPAP
ncbi:hypothetical protein EQ831_06110 [Pseudomonas sp. ALS1279]|nr:hypothetical protein EQ831_06110 [Pseudomonas sp. ALS1279]